MIIALALLIVLGISSHNKAVVEIEKYKACIQVAKDVKDCK